MREAQERLYFDYNASAPILPSVGNWVMEAMGHPGNASSVHTHGRALQQHVEWTRHLVLEHLKAPNHDVYFTSGATEANAMVLAAAQAQGMPVFASAIEHLSILNHGTPITIIPVTHQGVVDIDALEKQLVSFRRDHGAQPCMVSVMAANNETGVIQPLETLSTLCLRHGAYFHVDAAQGWGRMPLSLMDCHMTYVTLSAHKMGGLQGTGCLVSEKEAPMVRLYGGGGQEKGLRPGTLNSLGIGAFGRAFEYAPKEDWSRVQKHRETIEASLIKTHDVFVAGRSAARLANTLCLSMPEVDAQTQVIAFDLEGISISAGSACSSGKIHRSHVLKAMDVPEPVAKTCIRISLCPKTPQQAVQKFLDVWYDIHKRSTREEIL